MNGARFNQPFGDTVDWDLLPDLAIDRLNVVGSNPVFGLNALGGAVAVQMKNGFTYHGAEIDLLSGSFAKYQGQFQYGVESGNVAGYVAANGLQEGGWRDVQSSQLRNFFGDLGWRGERGEFHIDVITAANNRLNQPGTTPIQQLAGRSGRRVHRAEPGHEPLHARQPERQLPISRIRRRCKEICITAISCRRSTMATYTEFRAVRRRPRLPVSAPPGVFVTNRAGDADPQFP